MKSNKGKRIALLASAILVSAGLATGIGVTYALYSKQVKVINHVTIGNLSFDLKRTKLETYAIDSNTGFLAQLPSDENTLDLSKDGSKAFEAENAAPGASYKATFELTNTGGTAFTAKAEIPSTAITLTGVDKENRDSVLSNIEVSFDEGEAKSLLSEDIAYDLGSFAIKEKKTFTLQVQFKDTLGNEAQNAALDFALRLVATEAVSKSE